MMLVLCEAKWCYVKVELIADVCFDFLHVLNLHIQRHDGVLSLSSSVLAEHIADNQVHVLHISLVIHISHDSHCNV